MVDLRILYTGSRPAIYRSQKTFCLLLLALSFFVFIGCAGAGLKKARKAFHNGDAQRAVDILSDVDDSGLSRLVYLMEKGLLLHQGGRYEESVRELRKASDLIREQDIISAGQQASSLVVNEWVTEYKGEYCERLWVHTYLMMNYLLPGEYESALVEAKQAQKVYDQFPEALSEEYFTRALIAHQYGITIASSASATIGALIVGKSILIADALPLFKWFCQKRLIYNVAWRIFLYVIIVLLFQFLEELIPLISKYGAISTASEHVIEEIKWARFWATLLVLIVFLVIYSAATTVIGAIGRNEFLEIFFGSKSNHSTKVD